MESVFHTMPGARQGHKREQGVGPCYTITLSAGTLHSGQEDLVGRMGRAVQDGGQGSVTMERGAGIGIGWVLTSAWQGGAESRIFLIKTLSVLTCIWTMLRCVLLAVTELETDVRMMRMKKTVLTRVEPFLL